MSRQERFEDNIILESELPIYYNSSGEDLMITLDTLNEYMTLAEVSSEYGRDLDFDNRSYLKIIINERFSKLTPLQKQIAQLKYIDNLSFREIKREINKSLSTIHYHINKIDKILGTFDTKI